MTVRVRRLEARDKPVWLSLFKGYIEFYKATVPEDVIEMTWERLMAGAADFHIALVAVDDADSPIGLAHVLFHRSTWSPTWYCYLEDLFVDPARAPEGRRPRADRGDLPRGRRARLHAHLLDDPGVQLPRPHALRPGRHQVAVRAVRR